MGGILEPQVFSFHAGNFETGSSSSQNLIHPITHGIFFQRQYARIYTIFSFQSIRRLVSKKIVILN